MKVLLASHNSKKIYELQRLLDGACDGIDLQVLSLADIGFFEEIEEDADTFEGNAFLKAKVGMQKGYISIADDSGLCVDILDGAPGVYSARYAGEECDSEKNNDKLLQELRGVSQEERTAKFVCAICCLFPDGSRMDVRGECPGRILFERTGNGGFGYDPLFFSLEAQKSFAQLTIDEKAKYSHRGKAMREFLKQFSTKIKEIQETIE